MLTDDLIATFSSAQATFTERVHAVAPDQWQLGTPDTQWAVADLDSAVPAGSVRGTRAPRPRQRGAR